MPSAERNLGARVIFAIALLFIIVGLGTLGYQLIEGWSLLDSLYMAVITVTTVGFSEVRELDAAGKMLTTLLILFGVGAFTYTATTIANYMIAGELRGFLGQRRMNHQISQLTDHFIICGYGRVGHQVAEEFRRSNMPVVVLDAGEASLERAKADGYLVMAGDAGDDDALRRAGLERARGLVASVDDDATNLMVVLSARVINPKLFIVARANDEASVSKLRKAGADRVLSLYSIAGRRMAQMAVRPGSVEFLDVVMSDQQFELSIEDITVRDKSPLLGCEIGAAQLRRKTGVNIVGLRRKDGRLMMGPAPETTLEPGDVVMALGSREQLSKLREMAG